jgi:hypothetical protein
MPPTDRPPPPNHPHQQQLSALATLLAVFIGTLRADRIITAEQATAIFATADHLLGRGDEGMGLTLLATVESVSQRITGEPEA